MSGSLPPKAGAAALRLVLLTLGLGLAGWVLREVGVAPGTEWVDRFVRGQGLTGEAVFLAVGALATAVGVPRQAFAFLGGYAFGTTLGLPLALLAQAIGCGLSFGWARLVGRDWAARRLEGRLGRRLRPLHEALVASPFGATLALRLLPVGNNLALNLLAGLSGVSTLPFLTASVLGYLPQTLVFALLGDGVAVDHRLQLALGAALFGLSILLGMWMLHRHRAARALGDEA